MGSLAFLLHFFSFILMAYFGGTEGIEQEYDNYQEFTVVEGRKPYRAIL